MFFFQAPILPMGSLPPKPVNCPKLISRAVPQAMYWWGGMPKANPELRSSTGSGPGEELRKQGSDFPSSNNPVSLPALQGEE